MLWQLHVPASMWHTCAGSDYIWNTRSTDKHRSVHFAAIVSDSLCRLECIVVVLIAHQCLLTLLSSSGFHAGKLVNDWQ